ncbi:ADP-ribosylglycohydrolase family protein [Thermophilibacter provencensis]|uniref:ADP-ribosylglycohydrolase family protein n=1 Tax=Thermophilibacter provencensis TaxID=1852386 RepID=UPI0023577EA5|nr:ADP-ribosylglycohydrolase family protein [Thermophilibacter provencensis]
MARILRDCVYGQAVADALGVPYEFRPRGSFRCTDMVGHGSHNQPAGTWGDDTSMALAICDNYRELGRIDVDDIRERFVRWYRDGAYTVNGLFDIGNATREALERGHGLAGEWDNGNGSLMRTVPLAFTDATDDEVRAASAITHAHPTSTEACVAIVHIARDLIAGASSADVAGDIAARPVDEIRSGGFVRDTFDAALWCLANTSSYAECTLAAVNLGDDTDTTAAVAGALAGIVYGIERIPLEWLNKLRGKALIESCLF